MTVFLVMAALCLAVVWVDIQLDRRFPCDCSRTRMPYYHVQHERAGVMLGRAIWCSVIVTILLLGLSWILGPIFALVATFLWRRWWFHEKDKLKKKAAKALGAVSFDKHGRLVVVNK